MTRRKNVVLEIFARRRTVAQTPLAESTDKPSSISLSLAGKVARRNLDQKFIITE